MYEAYGGIVLSTGASANNRLANTKERDFSIGLDNHGFRYFDPEVGRYISPDPVGFQGGANWYVYVFNNPINRIDPLGLGPDEEGEAILTESFVQKNDNEGNQKAYDLLRTGLVRRVPNWEGLKDYSEKKAATRDDVTALQNKLLSYLNSRKTSAGTGGIEGLLKRIQNPSPIHNIVDPTVAGNYTWQGGPSMKWQNGILRIPRAQLTRNADAVLFDILHEGVEKDFLVKTGGGDATGATSQSIGILASLTGFDCQQTLDATYFDGKKGPTIYEVGGPNVGPGDEQIVRQTKAAIAFLTATSEGKSKDQQMVITWRRQDLYYQFRFTNAGGRFRGSFDLDSVRSGQRPKFEVINNEGPVPLVGDPIRERPQWKLGWD